MNLFFYPDDLEILETWNQNSSFKYFRVVRIEKQICPLVFWEKLRLNNFVSRSTDLYPSSQNQPRSQILFLRKDFFVIRMFLHSSFHPIVGLLIAAKTHLQWIMNVTIPHSHLFLFFAMQRCILAISMNIQITTL